MATTHCPACGLTVPYFCCEGLVCPACGYDEEQQDLSRDDAVARRTPQVCSQPPRVTESGAPQPPVP
jgi:uncharacterized Zn finger protein (UPF0148 family)